jgi:hypothetical protein
MRSSAACLALLFILSLYVVPMIHAQPPPPPEPPKMRFYLQPSDPTTGEVSLWGGRWGVGVEYSGNTTVFNMDTITPHGPLVGCKFCDFVTRPLVKSYLFKSFKLRMYISLNELGSLSVAVGAATSDLSVITYQYQDLNPQQGYNMQEKEQDVLNFTLTGLQLQLQEYGIEPDTVSVKVDAGKRLVFHFGAGVIWAEIGSRILGHSDQVFLFGDSEHASYIETDAVELQGQPVPEFPSFLIMLPVILALTILLRREHNRRH